MTCGFSSVRRITCFFLVAVSRRCANIRDWSLITGRGGGYKMGKSRVRNFLRPPPQDRVKLFVPPLFKSGNFTRPPPPYNMAKTSSYRIKTTPKLFVAPPPSEWLKLCPPALFIGVKLHMPPPLPFCSPAPPPRN